MRSRVVTLDRACGPEPDVCQPAPPHVRTFDTGATRDSEAGKLDFEGFLSPLALKRYAEYMHGHRRQPGGQLRESDNWQRGIPLAVYMKSAWRHFHEWWTAHRRAEAAGLEDAICAEIFNAFGYLHEILKARGYR